MSDPRPPRPYVDPTTADAEVRRRAPPPTPAWERASGAADPARRVVKARTGPKPQPTQGSYIARHWRGELSLVRSYWVNNVLLATPLALALAGLMSWITVLGESLQVGAIVLLLGLPLLLSLDVWCLVGAWRSARAYLWDGGSRLWGWLARISLALGALQLLVSIVFGFLPNLGDYWQMARGIDPLGQASLSLSTDGRALRVDGSIGMGDAARLSQLLSSEAARELRRVELASPGGRLSEAEQMASALKTRGIASRVVGTCASACTVVFLAGHPRQLAPDSRLGFHRASSGTYNPVFDELANKRLAATYRSLGLPDSLIDKALDTPSRSIWFAPQQELLSHGLIEPLPQTLAIALPAAGAPLADYEDALRLHPAWAALEQRSAGSLNAAARRMWAARSGGAPDEAVQTAALAELAQRMPALLRDADPLLRRRYVQLVAEQLRALLDAPSPGTRAACRDLLTGRLGVRQLLPPELQSRESQWLLDAAVGEPPRWLPKPPSAVEIEVLDRTVGRAALGLLSRLWSDAPDAGSPGAINCEAVIALLDRVSAQPPGRRVLAERLLFEAR